MDSAPPPEVEAKIRELAAAVPGVAAIEKCRIRRSGCRCWSRSTSKSMAICRSAAAMKSPTT